MRKFPLNIVLVLLLSTVFQIFFQNHQAFAQESKSEKIRVIYFYSQDCAKCRQIELFIEEIKNKYRDKIDFLEHDVKEKEECRQLFYHFVQTYNVPQEKAGTPLVFTGKDYLVGPEEIRQSLEKKIEEKLRDRENLLFDCHSFLEKWPNVERINFSGGDGSEVCGIDSEICSIENESNHKKISLALIITTAAIDSINPCAIAVLIFLLTVLISIKASRKRTIKIGLFYIGAVFATYYLAGLGLMKVITRFDMANEIGLLAGMIVLFAGILEIKEGLYPDGKQLLRIPEKTKPIFTKFLKKGTVLSVVIAGILVSAFELPCTGQVYLAILSMLSQEELKAEGYAYLFIYNLIFVLPLIIILIIAAWGFDIKRMEHMRKRTRMMTKILIGVVMILLGMFLLFQDRVWEMIGI